MISKRLFYVELSLCKTSLIKTLYLPHFCIVYLQDYMEIINYKLTIVLVGFCDIETVFNSSVETIFCYFIKYWVHSNLLVTETAKRVNYLNYWIKSVAVILVLNWWIHNLLSNLSFMIKSLQLSLYYFRIFLTFAIPQAPLVIHII